ncbi:prokaryotic phospholipase a2 domain-containing protein [Hirsutella rhossiliensis]|uniref:Prokaryotic phospholipase a2 domain-containing protein n=1 Tax=Hirsutella rhossiliensis TaxID=111463 RepID=A0A9P8SD69_9HYPO|nr:prokaryotic phospholipase a2 domain-containing protein [Hirsutella rhossiliensis]KAH0957634.1 prokaryotic phospholipase a2 domain-containing protein [Hirsutella rhossiliensis]
MIEPDAKAPKPNTDRDEQAPEPNANTIKTITDQYVFELAMPDFLKKRDAKDPESLDWESDGCTYVFDNPLGFSFVNGCYRHDFAYRNYKAQDRFTETAKDIIDQKFLFDFRGTRKAGMIPGANATSTESPGKLSGASAESPVKTA